MNTEYGRRLKAARKHAGLTQEALSKVTGIPQSTISTAETKGYGSPDTPVYAKACRVDPHWLATGEGVMIQSPRNVQPVTARSKVPLVSWVQAGTYREVQDMFEPGQAEEWEDVYETTPSENAFALRVEGDSMTSPYPGELSFPSGTIIVVDPNRAVDAGDFVVAKDVATQKATFKKLVHDAGRWFLKPLNTAYPTLEIDDPAIRVIGRVIEFRTGGKL